MLEMCGNKRGMEEFKFSRLFSETHLRMSVDPVHHCYVVYKILMTFFMSLCIIVAWWLHVLFCTHCSFGSMTMGFHG